MTTYLPHDLTGYWSREEAEAAATYNEAAFSERLSRQVKTPDGTYLGIVPGIGWLPYTQNADDPDGDLVPTPWPDPTNLPR